MFGNSEDELDPITFWTLLLLSGGHLFTFHEIAKTLNRSHENVWNSLQILQTKGFIKSRNGGFGIDISGIEFLAKKGINASKAIDESQNQEAYIKPKSSFFLTLKQVFTWSALPLILLLPSAVFSSIITGGYNFISVEKRLIQYLIWLTYYIILVLYIRLSYHHVLEYERLVIFRNGKIAKITGPGHVLLFPLIDNPKKVDLREQSKEVRNETCISKDSILMSAGFYFLWYIENPTLYLVKVSNLDESISSLTLAIARSTIAEYKMEEVLQNRNAIAPIIKNRIRQKTKDWGVEITLVEIREIIPPNEIITAYENRMIASLGNEWFRENTNAQIEAIRSLMVLGIKVDDQILDILRTSANTMKSNAATNHSKEEKLKNEKTEDKQNIRDDQLQAVEFGIMTKKLSQQTLVIALTVPIAITLVLYVLKLLPPSPIILWLIGMVISYSICLTDQSLRKNQVLPILLSIITNLISSLMSQQPSGN